VIRGDVKIGRGTKIESHASIGHNLCVVEIGDDNQIMSGAVVGGTPQDLSYQGELTKLVIGNKNIIREFVTMNCGTIKDQGVTRVGNQNLIMAYCHIAHDCQLADGIVIANSVQLAGHVKIGNYARIGGMTGIAQFIRLGAYSYIGGAARVNKDVLPYSIADGIDNVRTRAMNKIGLQRAGFSPEAIESLHKAFRFLIAGDRTLAEAMQKIETECPHTAEVNNLIEFIKTSEVGIAR